MRERIIVQICSRPLLLETCTVDLIITMFTDSFMHLFLHSKFVLNSWILIILSVTW